MPKPIIYLFGGSNGAGKTTFAREYLPTVGTPRFLNADEIARGLSPLQPESVALQAGRLVLEEFRALVKRGESFGLESTLSGKSYLNLLRWAKEQGYFLDLHYLWIRNSASAVKRVRQRVRKGGHHVPTSDIERRYQRSIDHFLDDYATMADCWSLWDNSRSPAKILADSDTHSIMQLRQLFSLP